MCCNMLNFLQVSVCFLVVFHQSIRVDATYIQGNYDIADGHYKVFEYRTPFSLVCNVTEPPPKEVDYELQWYKNNQSITKAQEKIAIHHDTLTIRRPTVDDVGSYSCRLVDVKNVNNSLIASADFEVIMKPTAKLVETLTVIEGEKLRLECTVQGYPAPTVEWRIGNTTYLRSQGRIKLSDNEEKKIANAILVIDEATMGDRGHYFCHGNNLATRAGFKVHEATVFVRVKDKLAALWPFLGICLEVIVLCTIIFIYEKKRNKTELEESDTDQSPEQDKK